MKKILFYGAGNISQALIMGLLSSGFNKNNIEYKEEYLTFHLGNDLSWNNFEKEHELFIKNKEISNNILNFL